MRIKIKNSMYVKLLELFWNHTNEKTQKLINKFLKKFIKDIYEDLESLLENEQFNFPNEQITANEFTKKNVNENLANEVIIMCETSLKKNKKECPLNWECDYCTSLQ